MHSVEEIERPLAQILEGWVLQQAVTGLMLAGELEEAEALCSQVTFKTHTHTHRDREGEFQNKTIALLPTMSFCCPRC